MIEAVIFDRDGTLINYVPYLSNNDDVLFYPGVFDACLKLKQHRILTFIATNQSGIGRGLFGWEEYELVNNQMLELLGQDSQPTAIYANSQIKQRLKNCWRKPSLNMLLKAKHDFNLNLEKSILIGDRLSDLQAGINAGLSKVFITPSTISSM